MKASESMSSQRRAVGKCKGSMLSEAFIIICHLQLTLILHPAAHRFHAYAPISAGMT